MSTIFLGCRSSQGLKRGIENSVFWPEIGSGLEQPGGTHPHHEFPGAPLQV